MKKRTIRTLLCLVFFAITLTSCGNTNPYADDPRYPIYQLALDSGFTGTYQDWLDSIKGEDGKNGETPHIGENGNWWIGDTDTGVPAKGPEGPQGEPGKDGNTPYIGENGNWWIGDTDTGVFAGYSDRKFYDSKDTYICAFSGQSIDFPSQTLVYDGNHWIYENTEWLTDSKSFFNPGLYVIEGKVTGLSNMVKCYLEIKNYTTTMRSVCGYVNGILGNEHAFVTLYNENYANTVKTNNGYYCISNVPDGTYSLKVECENYYLEKKTNININDVETENSLFNNVNVNNFYLKHIDDFTYYYSWSINEYCLSDEVSSSLASNEYVFDNETIYVKNNSSSQKLVNDYLVYLDGDAWSSEYASRLYDMFSKVGIKPSKKSIWRISNEHIDNDLKIEKLKNEDIVTISKDALLLSIPTSGTLNGTKGTFFSKRIYHAVIRFITDNGENTSLINQILINKFGVSIIIPDYEELTRGITDETADSFQQFTPEELLSILTMYEEMPQGMHKIDGFNYLVRRKNGQLHPLYPDAAAVTWPQKGYIEYVDISFTGAQFDIYRLIVHEKAHMLWANTINDELKNEWIKIGGWYEESTDVWKTTKQTEFVTAYAHNHNPNEDLAESIAYYICDPEKLMSRSPSKYNFLRDYIFNGSAYIRKIRDDLTFEVYNLYPDYDYPGQIITYSVWSTNKPFEDKEFHIRLELNHFENLNDGAVNALMRFVSNSGQIYDVWLYSTNEIGTILEGTLKVSKFSECGFWTCTSIKINDIQGNQRIENGSDFGCQLFVDNPLEDLDDPTYVDNSLSINSTKETVIDCNGIERKNTTFDIKLKINEKNPEEGRQVSSQLRIALKDNIGIGAKDYYLYYEEDGYLHAYVTMTEFDQSGEWEIRSIFIYDEAGNSIVYNTTEEVFNGDNIKFVYESTSSDYEAPLLDVNNINVHAEPTHPDMPNGETKVQIKLKIKDNISGFSHLRLWLKDPQGILHFYDYYGDSYGDMYYYGSPTEFKEYIINIILPIGSAPGTWGISEIEVSDMVKNHISYDFTETISFVITE